MSIQLNDISVYLGDIHGTRLEHLSTALNVIDISPSALLCTMDLDQVLSIQDLLELERRYLACGKTAVLVPGNHEAAIIHRIGIDSSTYRKARQDTNILELIEALNLPSFARLRQVIEQKLEITGGAHLALDVAGHFPTLLIHGALAGKQEKYLHEFPPDLQAHVRSRGDLWIRLESDTHIRANFDVMESQGLQVMLRGHDHYLAMRSRNPAGELCGHQLVVNLVGSEGIEYRAESPRSEDGADDMQLVDSQALSAAQKAGTLCWHELESDLIYVINCGPYYEGYFGLVRSATAENGPAVAFCQTKVSVYNEADRKNRLVPFLSAHQARQGKTFYELFPRDE